MRRSGAGIPKQFWRARDQGWPDVLPWRFCTAESIRFQSREGFERNESISFFSNIPVSHHRAIVRWTGKSLDCDLSVSQVVMQNVVDAL